MKTLIAAILAISFTLTANAKVLILKATDGTVVTLGYDKSEEASVASRSQTTWVKDLALNLSKPGQSFTAVVVGQCTVSEDTKYNFSLVCPNHPVKDWLHIAEQCEVDADPYTINYLKHSGLPALRMASYWPNGHREVCTYELAVVRDGEWLKDTVNGTSNFKLEF